MKFKTGEGRKGEFKVGEKVFLRFLVGSVYRKMDGSPRFPNGYAEVLCVIEDIDESATTIDKIDRRYKLRVSRRTLAYAKGMVLFNSGNDIFRKRTVGNGRSRKRHPKPTQDDRRTIAKALIEAGNTHQDVELFNAAKRLIL